MERKINLPNTLKGIRSWLKGTNDGRELLGGLTKEAIEEALEAKCRECQNIRPYPKVLIVLRRLYWTSQPGVTIYTEDGVSVNVLELPDMHSETAEMERRIEDYVELKLHRSWRHMLGLPSKRINDAAWRGVSLEETLRHVERGVSLNELGDACRFIDEIGKPPKEVT